MAPGRTAALARDLLRIWTNATDQRRHLHATPTRSRGLRNRVGCQRARRRRLPASPPYL